MFVLASGAGAARAIGVLSIPVLTRMYPPEHFGLLAVYVSVLQILLPFSTLRYLTAIPLPRGNRTAFALLTLSVGLAFSFSIILFILFSVIGSQLLNFFSLGVLAPFAWLVPLGVLGASLYEALTMWATRIRAYRIIAGTQIWQATSGEGLKLLLGMFWGRPVGLLLGHIVGHGGGLRYLFVQFWPEFRRMIPGLRWRHIRIVALRFRGFPTYRMPAQVLLAMALQAPLLLTAAFYGIETTGQMGLAMTAFTLPFLLVGQAASRAYYAETARLGVNEADKIMEALKKTAFTLGLLAAPVAVVLFLFAEVGAAFVLGEEWAMSGRFVALLSISLVPQFVSSTVVRTLDVLEAHRTVVMLHLTRFVVVSAAFIIAARTESAADSAVLAFSIILALHYLLQVAVIYYFVSRLQRDQS